MSTNTRFSYVHMFVIKETTQSNALNNVFFLGNHKNN